MAGVGVNADFAVGMIYDIPDTTGVFRRSNRLEISFEAIYKFCGLG